MGLWTISLFLLVQIKTGDMLLLLMYATNDAGKELLNWFFPHASSYR